MIEGQKHRRQTRREVIMIFRFLGTNNIAVVEGDASWIFGVVLRAFIVLEFVLGIFFLAVPLELPSREVVIGPRNCHLGPAQLTYQGTGGREASFPQRLFLKNTSKTH